MFKVFGIKDLFLNQINKNKIYIFQESLTTKQDLVHDEVWEEVQINIVKKTFKTNLNKTNYILRIVKRFCFSLSELNTTFHY